MAQSTPSLKGASRFLGIPKGASQLLGIHPFLAQPTVWQTPASSVALNLNEGWRRTSADRLQFFHIALGSIRECQAIVALERQAFTADEIDLLDHLAAATYRLVKRQPG